MYILTKNLKLAIIHFILLKHTIIERISACRQPSRLYIAEVNYFGLTKIKKKKYHSDCPASLSQYASVKNPASNASRLPTGKEKISSNAKSNLQLKQEHQMQNPTFILKQELQTNGKNDNDDNINSVRSQQLIVLRSLTITMYSQIFKPSILATCQANEAHENNIMI